MRREELHEMQHSIQKHISKTLELGRVPGEMDLEEVRAATAAAAMNIEAARLDLGESHVCRKHFNRAR